jgi:hypothetical protein
VSQRQRAKTQDRKSLTAAWQEIPWTKVQRHVFRLQKRIYQATQRGEVRTVRKLQNLLSKSWYARLLAVRRVTQDNTGRHTAGIDGVKSLQPPQRLRLANELKLDHRFSRCGIDSHSSLSASPFSRNVAALCEVISHPIGPKATLLLSSHHRIIAFRGLAELPGRRMQWVSAMPRGNGENTSHSAIPGER